MMIRFALPPELDTLYEAPPTRSLVGRMPLDVVENEKSTFVYAELPGMKKEDVAITFEDEVLTISGRRQEKEIPADARILLHEQRVREFERSIRIGHPVEASKMSATLQNGVLEVELPKAEAARPRTIAIS